MATGESIVGIQKFQQANQQIINALKPTGARGRMVKLATTATHRHAVVNTPVESGGLAAAHRMLVEGARGQVYIDPRVTNPRQRGRKPAEYGRYLHDQGMQPGLIRGVRAFYEYTVEHDGDQIAEEVMQGFIRELPRGN